jgi:predicted metal-dependent phosphotriesterase family hydrolase
MPRPLAGRIQTVLGVIAPDAIGITLPHEHLLIDFRVMFTEPAAASDKGRAWEPATTTCS